MKSLDDIERVWGQPIDEVVARTGCAIDRVQLLDIATLAVGKEYRRAAAEGLVSTALYQASVMTAQVRQVPWYVAVLDVRVLRLISSTMGKPFTKFDGIEPAPYLDSSSSLPVFVDLDDYGRRLLEEKPEIYELLFRGAGLEAAVWTPEWVDAARPRSARWTCRFRRARPLPRARPCAADRSGRPRPESARRDRAGEDVSLRRVDVQVREAARPGVGLDSFGGGGDPQRVRHRDDRGDERLLGGVGPVEIVHERLVDLHFVDLERAQIRERRVARPESSIEMLKPVRREREQCRPERRRLIDEHRLGELEPHPSV